jgi:hypothetical protein
MWNSGTSNPTVTHCAFVGNRGGGGGGMLNSASSPIVFNCTFAGNRAGGGGGMANEGGEPMVANCIFVGNVADQNMDIASGGGISNFESNLTITNCTFAGNRAAAPGFGFCLGVGGGMATYGTETSVANCIFWGNIGDMGGEIAGEAAVTYSDVEGGWSGGGSNNIDADPLFVLGASGIWSDDPTYDPASDLTTFVDSSASFIEGELIGQFVENDTVSFCAESALIVANTSTTISVVGSAGIVNAGDSYEVTDYRLTTASPCIDAGDNTAVPDGIETDLDGNPRFVDDPDTDDTGNGEPPIVDMGSYEFQGIPCPWDLDGNGTVGVSDLLLLLMNFGPCGDECDADFNEDGVVSAADLLELLANFGPCPGSACPWDVNGDGVVDQADVQQVLENMGPCDGCPEDINGDGVVNGQDVAAVITHFGPCP